MTIDPKALFIGMVFIANAGALMDLSMDVAISCEEIVYHRPDITRGALLKSGISIGRGVLGTQTTTLMLAYSGNYLSMLMYFAGQGTPVMDMLNLKYVSSQLMNTLVGQFRPGGRDADDRPGCFRALHPSCCRQAGRAARRGRPGAGGCANPEV